LVVPVSAEDVGKERDFNLHSNRSVAPDAIETALAELESKVAEALREIVAKRTPLPVENLLRVLSIGALYAVRNPGWRRFLIQFTEQTVAHHLRNATDTREKRERIATEMTAEGKAITADEIEAADEAYRSGRLIF